MPAIILDKGLLTAKAGELEMFLQKLHVFDQ